MITIEKFKFRQILSVFAVSLCIGYLLVSWFDFMVPDGSYWPLGVDIYPRWVGSRAVWQGESPYTAEVDRLTQSYVYGRPAKEGEDSFGFYYPAHAAIVLAPLTLLPAHTAALLWSASMWAVLSVIVFVTTQSLKMPAVSWIWIVAAFSIFFYRFFLLSVINGQYAIFILGIWGMVYYLIRREKEEAAGFLLALTTIKPSLSFLPLLVWLLWGITGQHKKFVYSFLLSSALFLAVSLLQLGWWIPEFLAELAEYDLFPRDWNTGDLFTLPGLIWLGGTLVLLYWGSKEYWLDKHEFPWVLFWGAISLNLLLTPHTWDYDIALMILPFLIYAPRYLQTKSNTAIWVTVFWLPWITWFIFVYFGYTTDIWVYLLWRYYPQILVGALLLFLFREKKQ